MVPVDGVWDYFSTHLSDLASNYHLIANNEEYGTEIYLTEEKGFPCFTVEVDGCTEFEAQTSSKIDAEKTYENLLDLFVQSDCDGTGSELYDEADEEDSIRVHEIFSAAKDFLTVLIEEDPYDAGLTVHDIDDIVSVVEEYLFDSTGISTFRPIEVDGRIVRYPYGNPAKGN